MNLPTPKPLSLLILRLSDSRDTSASSTHHVLADLALSALPGADIDFAFLPSKRAPRCRSHLGGRELTGFDLILATNSFVQEALNLPWLLHANGLSPWAPERPEAAPPVLLGGSNAFAAQCLARPDGSAVPDAFFFGEAEDVLPVFLRRWADAAGAKRARLAAATAGLDGFWVTGAPPAAPIRQAVARGPLTQARPHAMPDVQTAGTARLAVGVGCAAFCSFCFEGYERKPYRERPAADLLAQARALKAARGARALELDAFNLNTYADLAALVEPCARLFDTVAFKSQRADGLAACPALIDLERAAGKSSYTLGIEGVSARLRAFLCKSLSDEEIAASVKALLDRRVRELKLFYILTAHETPEDLAAFGDFCSRLRGWLSAPSACTRVVLSFGRLVRMPNTPLAFDRLFLEEADWRFCVDGVAAACRRAQLEHRFAHEWPDYLGTQLLAACRHEDADAVVRLACEGLTCHGPWREGDAARLRAAVSCGAGLPPIAHPPAFPFVRRAVSPAFTLARWESARQFLDAGYCLGSSCGACGACADAGERQSLTSHARAPAIPAAVIDAVARIEADKRRLAPVFRRATLPAEYAGHSPEWASARLMQRLLTRHPQLVDALLSADEALFTPGDDSGRRLVPAGQTVIRLRAWDAPALTAALTQEPDLFPPAAALPPSFAPGAYARATWALSTAMSPREAAQAASAWLAELRLPHTLRRDGDGWRAELSAAAAKKKCVFSLAVAPSSGGSQLTLTFSAKATPGDLLSRLPPQADQPSPVCSCFEPA